MFMRWQRLSNCVCTYLLLKLFPISVSSWAVLSVIATRPKLRKDSCRSLDIGSHGPARIAFSCWFIFLAFPRFKFNKTPAQSTVEHPSAVLHCNLSWIRPCREGASTLWRRRLFIFRPSFCLEICENHQKHSKGSSDLFICVYNSPSKPSSSLPLSTPQILDQTSRWQDRLARVRPSNLCSAYPRKQTHIVQRLNMWHCFFRCVKSYEAMAGYSLIVCVRWLLHV